MPKRTNGKPAKQDLARVKTIGENLRALIDELNIIFPEREWLMDMIQYALLTREHVMIFGPKGTGKSDLFSTLMDSIQGAVTFRIALSKYSTETAVFGIPDPKRMRDEGIVVYDPKHNILSANYAELDEFLDANEFLLRTLLGILNERSWKRGHEVYPAKLMSAVATTNCVPEEEVRNNPRLEAVLDRFLFQCAVQYLEREDSRRRMYKKYLEGATPTVAIPLEDLIFISNIVVSANQITDPYLIEVYDRVMQAYRREIGEETISDRRACKLLQLVEASALLYGRFEVHPSDFLAVKHGLCFGKPDKISIFNRVATPIVEEAAAKMKQSIDDVQAKLLSEYTTVFSGIAIPQEADGNVLVKIKRELSTLRKKVDDVKPELAHNNDTKRDLLRSIDAKTFDVQKAIDEPQETPNP